MPSAVSNEMLVSPWKPIDEPPMFLGVYQVKVRGVSDVDYYAYWNGTKFGYITCKAASAYENRNEITGAEPTHWRGLM